MMKTATKTSTIPLLRVTEELRAAAEAALMESETFSGFVLEAIQFSERFAIHAQTIPRPH